MLFGGFVMSGYNRYDMGKAIEAYVINSKYRQVLYLKFVEGMTHEQVAEAAGYSTQHVKHICKTYKDYLLSHL